MTGAVSWRQEGIFYKKNQVFLDIVENVNLLLSTKGTVLRADVQGKILMRTLLSGMPDLKLGLNDKLGMEKAPGGAGGSSGGQRKVRTIELDDHTFHHCVNMGKFASERTVSFTPPDGEFELMKYRITEGVNLPFRVLPIIKELGRSRVEANVKVRLCGCAARARARACPAALADPAACRHAYVRARARTHRSRRSSRTSSLR